MNSRWWIVFASVLGLLVGNGPIMQFTFGVLLAPISREFGWNRGTVSSAIVVGLWMTGIATPVVGRWVDRFGIRPVALPAIALFSLATASVALVPASPAAFTALYALMGLGAAGQTPLIYAKAISARFDEKRGLALGIAMAGVGLGAAIVPQFAQALIGDQWPGRLACGGRGDQVQDTTRKPRFLKDLGEHQHRQRRLLSGLDDHGASRCDRRTDLPGSHR